MTPVEELIAAWEAWDEKPGSTDRANRRMDAIQAVTPDWLALHTRIAELRRSGLSVRQAITSAVRGVPDGYVPAREAT